MSREVPAWRAYDRWRALAGPLADFVLPTPFFLEPFARPRRPHDPVAGAIAGALTARAAGPGRALALLEATPGAALATACALLVDGWRVAPMFGRWPVAPCVLPVAPLAAGLAWIAATATPRAAREDAPLVVLLDEDRSRPVGAAVLRRRFDNRYEYNAHMLPPAEHLRRWDVARVCWMGASADVPADLAPYVASLAGAGLPVDASRAPRTRR